LIDEHGNGGPTGVCSYDVRESVSVNINHIQPGKRLARDIVDLSIKGATSEIHHDGDPCPVA
jgi:hypothetical protein